MAALWSWWWGEVCEILSRERDVGLRYIYRMGFFDQIRGVDKGTKAIAAYNEGLDAKYVGDWAKSLECNKRADELRPGDEATLWNLAIAATALNEWDEARRAWRAVGVTVNTNLGEIDASCGRACVRLNPSTSAEVVWGQRIDPARIRVLNVPFASSERRYGDILINDGAPEGTRISNGDEFPVFNELGIWKMSAYSTFEVEIAMPNQLALQSLEEKCDQNDMWVEDWGTVRTLCAACSRGNPGEHVCSSEETGQSKFGFAAKSEVALRRVLKAWANVEESVVVGAVKLVVSGISE